MIEADNVSTSNDSFQEMKTWPWPRNIFANVLMRMKEFGASTAVFDIEYLSPSNVGVNKNAVEDVFSLFNDMDSLSYDEAYEKLWNAVYRDYDDFFARA